MKGKRQSINWYSHLDKCENKYMFFYKDIMTDRSVRYSVLFYFRIHFVSPPHEHTKEINFHSVIRSVIGDISKSCVDFIVPLKFFSVSCSVWFLISAAQRKGHLPKYLQLSLNHDSVVIVSKNPFRWTFTWNHETAISLVVILVRCIHVYIAYIIIKNLNPHSRTSFTGLSRN